MCAALATPISSHTTVSALTLLLNILWTQRSTTHLVCGTSGTTMRSSTPHHWSVVLPKCLLHSFSCPLHPTAREHAQRLHCHTTKNNEGPLTRVFVCSHALEYFLRLPCVRQPHQGLRPPPAARTRNALRGTPCMYFMRGRVRLCGYLHAGDGMPRPTNCVIAFALHA